eukprot:TRINITY_DN1789_c2_g2_i1.p2 TRINITY_DN1789_c2_g2~~TRINITY_DN1789_c2_g2_i1.p2  ORF type:complete len:251 (+),score=49.01 TRINITY_DN1789_c2_g2_i1:1427-2179(+)
MATVEKCGQQYQTEIFFPAIIKTAANLKVPKAQSNFLKHLVDLIEQKRLFIDSHQNIIYLKQLIKLIAKITLNKNAEVRDGAISVINSIYQNLGQKFVLETIFQMGSEVQKVLQALKIQIRGIETDYSNFLRMKSRGQQWHPENNNNNNKQMQQQNDEKQNQNLQEKQSQLRSQQLFQQQNTILQQQQQQIHNNNLIMQESQKQNIENMEIDDEDDAIETQITLFKNNENNNSNIFTKNSNIDNKSTIII